MPAHFDIGRHARSLGMRVVADLARQLGGSITVPQDGKGARFPIDMPLAG
ncbi:hypothetical protein [Methylobacterium oxalidis]|uniref:Histidine kinase/HSP90-like ATPase domain-containing protein n=1 Tax=Methylobacterium oxalidis TaxID=944322 RepID=A0A512J553_9HYPH|nr:hypothetical protein MOX02_31440 [Methylobacterium oxalidis]GLS62603.1 hypothetical protein GCM10007888_09840 [Methylobacterium oxalidis]